MKLAKVGMISSSYPRNHNDFAGVFVRSLAEHVADLGHEVHMLVAYDPDVQVGQAASKVKIHYFPYAWPKPMHVIGYGRSLKSDVRLKKLALAMIPSYLLSATAHLTALALRERFDIIHAHWVIPTGPIAALVSRILRIPLVVSLHGSDVYVLDRKRAFRNAAKQSLAVATSVIACSDDLKNRTVAAGVPEKKVLVIPYGVDTKAFDRDRLDGKLISDVRMRALGFDGTTLVLGLGRLVQKKGFEYLIKAIPQVTSQHPGVRFVIAGDGDESARLHQLARELDVERQILFPGAVAWHMTPYYLAASDVVVVPSVHDSQGNVDGLPNVLLEAMASGKPVVASAIAGIPSAVRNGADGFLVAEKSPSQIADALRKCAVSTELRETMGRNARQRVLESFSWTGVASRLSAIYEEAVPG